MITQINGISTAPLSKGPQAMDLDRLRVPRDVAFTGGPAAKVVEEGKDVAKKFFPKLWESAKNFVTKKVPTFFADKVGPFFKKTVPEVAGKVWDFVTSIPGKIGKLFKKAPEAAEAVKGAAEGAAGAAS